MEIRFGSVRLCDLGARDMEDCVRWMTTQREWHDWDAPWDAARDFAAFNEDEYRSGMACWLEDPFFPRVRTGFQLYRGKEHIGFVNSYFIGPQGETAQERQHTCPFRAVGIDLCSPQLRGKGLGTDAMCAFIHYYLRCGEKEIYTQTWSGNARMRALAQKLGFDLFLCKTGAHEVDGVLVDDLTYRLDIPCFVRFYRMRRWKRWTTRR